MQMKHFTEANETIETPFDDGAEAVFCSPRKIVKYFLRPINTRAWTLYAEGKPPLEKLQNAKNRPYDKWRGRAIRERFPI